MCTVVQGIWEMNELIMLLRLVPLGLVSSHNLSSRWAHHSFASASCFASCNNLGDVLDKLRDIRTEMVFTSQHRNRG